MGTIDLNVTSSQCRKCGNAYGRLKGNFAVSYSQLYKGTGYLPYCKQCVDDLYNGYLALCKDPKLAVRQMCRKLDIYWHDEIYDYVSMRTSPRSTMTAYITRANNIKYIGKSFDDTLQDEGTLWSTHETRVEEIEVNFTPEPEVVVSEPVDPEIIDFWGADFAPDFLMKLDRRYKDWTEGQGDLERGSISLFKQICILEETIARDAAAGKPVDKNMNTLNTLLGSLNMKPVQKKTEADAAMEATPVGVWIRRFENERPIPDPDPELKDVDKIVHYIQVFFLGHLAKMLGKTTVYSKMYEKEIARLRVENPELSEEYADDEEFFEERFATMDGDDQ